MRTALTTRISTHRSATLVEQLYLRGWEAHLAVWTEPDAEGVTTAPGNWAQQVDVTIRFADEDRRARTVDGLSAVLVEMGYAVTELARTDSTVTLRTTRP